jgi:hypothetical protein
MGGAFLRPRGSATGMGTEIAIALLVILVVFAVALFAWRVAETKRGR